MRHVAMHRDGSEMSSLEHRAWQLERFEAMLDASAANDDVGPPAPSAAAVTDAWDGWSAAEIWRTRVRDARRSAQGLLLG